MQMSEAKLEDPAAQPLDILIIEDNTLDAELCVRALQTAGWNPRAEVIQTSHEFCARISTKNFHLILMDYHLPGWNALEALELLTQMAKDIPVILMAGALKDHLANECLRKGAADFVQKDRLALLPVVVERVLREKQLRESLARAEKRAGQAEKRFQRLAELSPDPLYIWSAEKLLFTNAPGAKLIGFDNPEDLIGKSVMSVVQADYRGAVKERFESLSGNLETAFFDLKLVRSDGKFVDVRAAATALLYQDKPAVQFIAHDVTERKRVDEAIKSLASFAQLNPNPVLEFSREGKLTYYNEAASEVARSLGKEHLSAILPAETPSMVQLCLSTGQKKQNVETILNGRTFSWSFFPIKSAQVVHCYVADITERLNLEAQLRHSQKLESVGRLAGGVAHDFNNILTVIQGHTGLLRSDPQLKPDMEDSLQQVSRAAERACKLTNQLLMFSRKNSIQPRRLELNEVLANFSTLLHRTLGEDIAFEFNYSPHLPQIYADLGMIEQVIINLAVNARDAMPKGGQLVVGTTVADIGASYVERFPEGRTGRFVCLSITDTGCGMDEVTLSRLFEPFFTTKEFGKGTGLGLATVYGIIKRHQGWIEVQSHMGQGSTFRIYLPPADQMAEKRSEKPSHQRPGKGSETILVVEDEAPVRSIIKHILERSGYRILEAASGMDALTVWHQHQDDIALLLTDMVMPVGINGQELADKFKSQKPSLKVIYTSGYTVETAGTDLLLMEGLSFLQKPFDAAQLTQAVRGCLDT